MDPSSLTKDQLLELLRQKESASSTCTGDTCPVPSEATDSSEAMPCLFLPQRGERLPCPDAADTPYGFCRKHSRTVQAKKAKAEYDGASSSVVSPASASSALASSTSAVASASSAGPSAASYGPPLKTPSSSATPLKTPLKAPATSTPLKTPLKAPATTLKTPLKAPATSTPSLKTPLKAPQVATKTQSPAHRKKVIRKNLWGRYEDLDTHMVFDVATKEAYGIQDHTTGRVNPLQAEHIEICRKKGWKYFVAPDEDDSDEDDSDEDDSDEDDSDEDNSDEDEDSEEEDDDEDDDEDVDDDDGDDEDYD